MCLTSTTDVIDFRALKPTQKKKLAALKRKLQAHRKILKKRIDELDRGLRKLEQKSR